MTRSYPYLYRIFKILSLTVFLLSLAEWFLSFGTQAFLGFCLYGAVLICFWELAAHSGKAKEIYSMAAVFLILVFLLGVWKREWVFELYARYPRQVHLAALLPAATLFLSLISARLTYFAPAGFLFLLYAAVSELLLQRAGVVGLIFFLLLALIEYQQRRFYGKEGENRFSGFFVLPLCLCLCLSFLPVSENPYPFARLKQAWEQLREGAYVLYTEFSLFTGNQSSDFLVHFSGYEEEGGIGGSLLQSDRPALTVSVPGSLRGNLYLTGNIQNHYENNVWSFTATESSLYGQELEKELTMDYLEFLYALYQTGHFDEERAYVWHTAASLTYDGLYTKDMFFPLKLYEFRHAEEYKSLANKFTAAHPLKQGDSYTFRYMALNYGSPVLESLIRERQDISYQPEPQDNAGFVSAIVRSYPPLRNSLPLEGFEALLAQRELEIRESCLQLPEEFSEAIAALTREVIGGADTDYDKLKAIEAFLQGYTYTRTPEKTGGDAVMEFLFETKEGYCTYFASAFVLMSRSAGIPARYVNGFCVPVYSEQRSEFVVGSDRAHAWPEAYLTGIGWLSFEPTAGYSEYHDTPWTYAPPSEQSGSTEETGEPETRETETAPLPETETEQPPVFNEEMAAFAARAGLFCLLLLPASLAASCWFRLRRGRKRYERSSPEERICLLMYYELALLQYRGFQRAGEETLLQYQKRVTERCEPLAGSGLDGLVSCYMACYYGSEKPDSGAVSGAEQCIRRTEQLYQRSARLRLMLIRLHTGAYPGR